MEEGAREDGRRIRLPAPFAWAERVLTAVIAVDLFVIMALTFVDVFGRYIFDAPVYGGFELVKFMLAILIFAAIPLVTFEERHIAVAVFDNAFRGRAAWLRRLLILCGSLLVLVVITWRLWAHGRLLGKWGHETGLLEWPLAPLAYAMSGLSALGCMLALLLVVRHVAGRGGR